MLNKYIYHKTNEYNITQTNIT